LNLEEKFIEFVQSNDLLKNTESILLGVSGGPDSLVMLELFFKFKNYFGINIAAAHLDHLFRVESTSEADFVEEKAKNMGLEFYRKKVDVPKIVEEEKMSAESAARRERFKFFREIYFKFGFDLLALAHHRDDQVETILLNIFRGSGLRGLSGIEKRLSLNDMEIIHPLLNLSKKEIIKYCSDHQLKPRIDKSNKENIYSRNIIRNKILPIVEEEINPSVRKVIARNADLIAEEENFLDKSAEKKFLKALISSNNKILKLDLNIIKKYDNVILRRILRKAYQQLNNSLDDLYLDHILELEKLLSNTSTGRGIDLPGDIKVIINYQELVFSKKGMIEEDLIKEKIKLNLNTKQYYDYGFTITTSVAEAEDIEFNLDNNTAVLDLDKLNLPLYFRSRKPGDSFVPLGMKGEKKIKDFLIDEKVPRYNRDSIPIIVDSEDNIVWLAGFRISENYKVTDNTNQVLVIKILFKK
jgi:tRNA(Ile)-lysidine synthase